MAEHLALFIRSLAGGGAERSVRDLAAGLAGLGHRVDLVVGTLRGAFAQDLPAAVRPVDLGGPRWPRTLAALARHPDVASALGPSLLSASPPGVIGCAPALADYLRRERPRALFTALVYSNVTALWARRMAGTDTRIVVSERNAIDARVACDRRRRTRRIPALVARFYPEADAVAGVSRGVAEEVGRIAGLAPERVGVIHNPVVTDVLRSAADREAGPPPHAWLAPGERPVVLGAGKLKPQKGFDVLLRAFAELRARRPVRLVVLGRGPEQRRLERLAAELGVTDEVLWPGFVSDPFAWMRRAAVFALSSRFEGLPGVLIQALACGCPAVSTDCDHGPREILDGEALVPVDDASALAAALARVLDQPPPASALRARAAGFDMASALARTLPLLLGAPAPVTSESSAASRSATASMV